MKIAIIGAGAIGSVVAAYLTKAGKDVALVGKPEHVEAINKNGLKVIGIRGDETFQVKAIEKLDQEYDLVIFTTKTQDLEAAYQHNCDFLEECFCLTSQNGVQGDNILGVHFDKFKMYSSIVMFGATYVEPGTVTFNFEGDWILGRPYAPLDPKAHEIAEILGSAFNIVPTENIMGMKWVKLFVNFNNCIPAVVGKSMQETFADMDLCRLSIRLLKEGVDIVNKAKIELESLPNFPTDRIYGLTSMPEEQAAGIINQTLTKLSDEPLYGSILQSIMRKKKSEIEFINGEVCALARQMRQETPLNDRIVELVHEVERTGEFLEFDELKRKFNLIQVSAD